MSYTFNFAEAQGVIDALSKITTDIDSALTTMETTVEKHLAEWSGSAQAEYKAAKAKWDQDALDMASHLNSARIALGAISGNYSQTELYNQRNFSEINGGR